MHTNTETWALKHSKELQIFLERYSISAHYIFIMKYSEVSIRDLMSPFLPNFYIILGKEDNDECRRSPACRSAGKRSHFSFLAWNYCLVSVCQSLSPS